MWCSKLFVFIVAIATLHCFSEEPAERTPEEAAETTAIDPKDRRPDFGEVQVSLEAVGARSTSLNITGGVVVSFDGTAPGLYPRRVYDLGGMTVEFENLSITDVAGTNYAAVTTEDDSFTLTLSNTATAIGFPLISDGGFVASLYDEDGGILGTLWHDDLKHMMDYNETSLATLAAQGMYVTMYLPTKDVAIKEVVMHKKENRGSFKFGNVRIGEYNGPRNCMRIDE